MNIRDTILGGLFLAAGAALAIGAAGLPPGAGELPGPGFFPGTIAAIIVLLACAQLYSAFRDRAGAGPAIGDIRGVAAAAGLLFVYLLLWGTGWFALRTAVYLLLLLRFFGQGWKQAAAVSITVAAAVTLAFQYGLRVSLE